MKTRITLLTALLAMVYLAAPAAAQEPARRNNNISARQENKAERKQQKVDRVQSSTNISNQPVTDNKLRHIPDTQSDRRSGLESRSGNNSGTVSGQVHGNVNNGNVNNGNVNHGNVNHGNYGNGNYGYGNNNKVNHGSGHGGYIPGYNNAYPGNRPPIPSVRNYNRVQVYERTNAAEIVVNTLFATKMEAYYYIARLLDERYYTVASYGNNYNWLRSEVSFIPTPFDWSDPMTHNQFQMYFKIVSSFGRIKVYITAQWRESVLSNRFLPLRFQPSNSYSTYYAWNVLEDIADNIPNTSISYRTSDLF